MALVERHPLAVEPAAGRGLDLLHQHGDLVREVRAGAAGLHPHAVADLDVPGPLHALLPLRDLLGQQLGLAQLLVGVRVLALGLVLAADAELLHLVRDEVAVGVEVGRDPVVDGRLELLAQLVEAVEVEQLLVGLRTLQEQRPVRPHGRHRVPEGLPDVADAGDVAAMRADPLELLGIGGVRQVDVDAVLELHEARDGAADDPARERAALRRARGHEPADGAVAAARAQRAQHLRPLAGRPRGQPPQVVRAVGRRPGRCRAAQRVRGGPAAARDRGPAGRGVEPDGRSELGADLLTGLELATHCRATVPSR
jgi:hypothetical protein